MPTDHLPQPAETDHPTPNEERQLNQRRDRRWIAACVGSILLSTGLLIGVGRAMASPNLNDTGAGRALSELKAIIDTRYLYPVTPGIFEQGAAEGAVLAARLDAKDPYSRVLDPDEAREEDREINESAAGIGASLEQHGENWRVVGFTPGSKAPEAGLKVGDVLSLPEGPTSLRGEAGAAVTVTVLRGDSPVELSIERVSLEQAPVLLRRRVTIGGQPRIVAALQVPSFFSEDITPQLKKLLRNPVWTQASGALLDLRGNSGGFLDAGEDLADAFLSQGVISQEQGRVTKRTRSARAEAGDLKLPLVTLIDGGSASATEVLAAALAENGRSRLVGERTRGKGRTQDAFDLRSGARLILTTGRWLTPQGRDIQGKGLEPHLSVRLQITPGAQLSGSGLPPQTTVELRAGDVVLSGITAADGNVTLKAPDRTAWELSPESQERFERARRLNAQSWEVWTGTHWIPASPEVRGRWLNTEASVALGELSEQLK